MYHLLLRQLYAAIAAPAAAGGKQPQGSQKTPGSRSEEVNRGSTSRPRGHRDRLYKAGCAVGRSAQPIYSALAGKAGGILLWGFIQRDITAWIFEGRSSANNRGVAPKFSASDGSKRATARGRRDGFRDGFRDGGSSPSGKAPAPSQSAPLVEARARAGGPPAVGR